MEEEKKRKDEGEKWRNLDRWRYGGPFYRDPQKPGLIERKAKVGAFGEYIEGAAQVNLVDPRAREYMINVVLRKIRDLTDGGNFRADLAHLGLWENVYRTLGFDLPMEKVKDMMPHEFWEEFMEAAKGLLAIAEAYDEGDIRALQRFGFKTYNKRLYDFLKDGDVAGLRHYLFMNGVRDEYIKNSVFFTENHDEPPALDAFQSPEKAMAATDRWRSGVCPVPLRQMWACGG